MYICISRIIVLLLKFEKNQVEIENRLYLSNLDR